MSWEEKGGWAGSEGWRDGAVKREGEGRSYGSFPQAQL